MHPILSYPANKDAAGGAQGFTSGGKFLRLSRFWLVFGLSRMDKKNEKNTLDPPPHFQLKKMSSKIHLQMSRGKKWPKKAVFFTGLILDPYKKMKMRCNIFYLVAYCLKFQKTVDRYFSPLDFTGTIISEKANFY